MNLRNFSFILCVVTPSAMAQLADKEGISGEIALTTGFASSTSNFNTEGEDTISSEYQKGSSDNGFMAFPLGSIAYTFGQELNQQVYAGTTRQDIATGTVVLEVGYKYQFDSRMVVDVSILPTVMSSKTWANPYLVDSARTETDASGNAFRFKVNNIAGSNFTIDSAYATKDIENDDVVDVLKRDADTIYLKGQYRLPLSRTSFVLPSVIYQSSSADGKASSYDQYGAEVSFFKIMQRHQLVLTAGYNQRTFGAENPIYTEIRKDNKLSFFAAYEYTKFMDWQDWSFISFAGYSSTDSNITFYDESEYIVTVGLNYKF
ncbi:MULTISPECIES: DUF2860 domain-containing protein [Aliivibrio]|uniref:DUF2860 domain-containing protein n=1 Tax=Aliivibrio finisterrensis TaxID=511998 RepID=A0A4Q5KSF3_9GAMM|nr:MULTISPECIES: DUF2860 domain-containing protein [Aliivibrio]MDD9179852.1 DUF2860 domain-containing protein [Aliivibrio sp. A6]RYU50336.1 DUF2860 domain-containing protein [Aliivibrio finisterrensis]RYU55635.1 DUF2860 domain-containing protein [Aliivibrio finisterrensis]RYU60268.1 DUF2860 domain-containing protein [Aliivibrio finisterrensis]RYU63382.1 DUF2860 domain-containing protein [Aliivibrio finisterrensis]